jgi:hypothetical protein
MKVSKIHPGSAQSISTSVNRSQRWTTWEGVHHLDAVANVTPCKDHHSLPFLFAFFSFFYSYSPQKIDIDTWKKERKQTVRWAKINETVNGGATVKENRSSWNTRNCNNLSFAVPIFLFPSFFQSAIGVFLCLWLLLPTLIKPSARIGHYEFLSHLNMSDTTEEALCSHGYKGWLAC